jgi:hypothetical protein
MNDAVLAEIIARGGGAAGVEIERLFALRVRHENGDGGGFAARAGQTRDTQAVTGYARFSG